jgi:hypothetical protein
MNVIKDLHACQKCGIVFDIRFRSNNDCPVCHSGEHVEIQRAAEDRMNQV